MCISLEDSSYRKFVLLKFLFVGCQQWHIFWISYNKRFCEPANISIFKDLACTAGRLYYWASCLQSGFTIEYSACSQNVLIFKNSSSWQVLNTLWTEFLSSFCKVKWKNNIHRYRLVVMLSIQSQLNTVVRLPIPKLSTVVWLPNPKFKTVGAGDTFLRIQNLFYQI